MCLGDILYIICITHSITFRIHVLEHSTSLPCFPTEVGKRTSNIWNVFLKISILVNFRFSNASLTPELTRKDAENFFVTPCAYEQYHIKFQWTGLDGRENFVSKISLGYHPRSRTLMTQPGSSWVTSCGDPLGIFPKNAQFLRLLGTFFSNKDRVWEFSESSSDKKSRLFYK